MLIEETIERFKREKHYLLSQLVTPTWMKAKKKKKIHD